MMLRVDAKARPRYGGVVAFVAVAGVAMVFGSVEWLGHRRLVDGPTWPVVQATITQSRIRPCSKGPRWAPAVTYRYTVAGQSHDGDVEFSADHCGSSPAAEDIAAAYPVGHVLAVHVDPRDPDSSLVMAP